MSNPNGLVSLLEFAGEHNVCVQSLSNAAIKVQFQKKQTKVTFVTEPEYLKPEDTQGKPEYVGMIVWVKSEDIDAWQNSKMLNQMLTSK